MYQAFLALLVLAWAVYLGSTFLGRRGNTNSGSSIKSFSQQLRTIRGASPSTDEYGRVSVDPSPLPVPPWAAPISLRDAHQRRVEVIFTLLGGAAMALILGLLITRWSLLLHVVLDLALIGYLFMLARSQQLAAERSEKVYHLDARDRFQLRPSATGAELEDQEAELAIAVGAGSPLTRRPMEPTPGFRVIGGGRQ